MGNNSAQQGASPQPRRSWPDLRAIWRWHFYASLFCIPFVLWLSVTGALYLFRPQIESFIDAPYKSLPISGALLTPSQQVERAVQAVPGSRLAAYQLPEAKSDAVQVLVGRGADRVRVYVHPQTGEILKKVDEDKRFMRQVFHLHGELLLGDRGSLIVELAACWAIVMIVTGLILWWPRGARGLGGIVYPRLEKKFFWRDLHAVVGVWVSVLGLFLLVTGLPWTKNWGEYLKTVRAITHTTDGPQDWSTGRTSELAARISEMGHEHHAHEGHMSMINYSGLNMMAPNVAARHWAPPVLISPPKDEGADWSARSDAANRPLRVNAKLDGDSGEIHSVKTFTERHPIDQAIGIGVAAHEGQLFGWINVALGLAAALGLCLLALSGVVLWLKRRKTALFAPPDMLVKPRLSLGVGFGFVLASVILPTLGASALLMLAFERAVLRRIPFTRTLFGLS